jgi:hypothetical protein
MMKISWSCLLGRYLLPSASPIVVCVEVLHVLVRWQWQSGRFYVCICLIRSHVQVERCGLFILGLVDVPACAVRAV